VSIGARIAAAALVLVAALLQVSIAYRIEIGTAYPNVLVLVVSAIALLCGSLPGAAYGFLAGLAVATFAAMPLGTHALMLVLIGYTVGRVGEALVTDDHPIPPLVAGVLATLAMQLGRPLVEFLVNPDVGQVDGFVGKAAMMTVISSVLAVPVYLLVRRVLAWAQHAMPAGAGTEVAR
jgi:rod shape-determining protein MreD